MNIRMKMNDTTMAAKAIEIAIDISKGSFKSLTDLFGKKCMLEYLPKGPKTDITHTLEELYPKFVDPECSIPISEKDQYLLMRVFEMIARIGMGQFTTMIEFISPLITYEGESSPPTRGEASMSLPGYCSSHNPGTQQTADPV